MRQKYVVLLALLGFGAVAADPPPPAVEGKIAVNQAGYVPGAHNRFYPEHAGTIRLERADTQAVVAEFQIDEPALGDELPNALEPGWYRLIGEGQQSVPFPVAQQVLTKTIATLLRAYRFQHAGVALHDPYTGLMRPAAHLQDGVLAHEDEINPQGTVIDGRGGWYDAGDFGKYVATTAITAARLMDASSDLELAGYSTGDAAMPEMLSEALIGLDWLGRMQRSDGAFYRKIGGVAWPPLVSPHEDTQTRFVYGISTPDSAKAVAALAQASRVFKLRDPLRSERYLAQAQLGWQWLELQPEQIIEWHEGDDGGSGPYMYNQWDTQSSLEHDRDDRFWAAVELYLSTKQSNYLDYAKRNLPQQIAIFEWKDPSVLGLWHLQQSGVEPTLSASIRQQFLSHCDGLMKLGAQAPFQISNQRFIWGSNKMVAEEGVLFSYCYRLNSDPNYLAMAWSQWHYLFGANPFAQSYVTGVGIKPVRQLHHIWGRAVGVVPPGMMVGGPNQDSQAGFAPKGEGMHSYIDDARDYAVNEFAIDYNASALGLASLLYGTQYQRHAAK
ncbi:glycoside hydrolase family 9 protein [Ferrimonas pelagia]|uniref:Endoglucanase n=1 Tax=Ferrimonas pelagia TaxID=1177826 RepID=A0ABP9FJS4_9GAMM